MSLNIVKAGWLHRRSTVLRKWKQYWFVLSTDGTIKYFDSQTNPTAEEVQLMPARCLSLKSGGEVKGVSCPPGMSSEHLLVLEFTDATWTLCASNPGEFKSWLVALEELRIVRCDGFATSLPPAYPSADVAPAYTFLSSPTCSPAAPAYASSSPPPYET